MKRFATIALALVLTCGQSSAFQARNGLPVAAHPSSGFVVSWRGASGAPAFWCAAGDYVIGSLGLSSATTIYRYDAPIRRRGEGIRFGFDPARAEQTGLVRLQGDLGLSAAYARGFCDRDRR